MKGVSDTFAVIIILHRFIGFENTFKNLSNISFSLNFGLAVCARILVTYIDYYINTSKLEEALDNEATIVEIKSREQANKEMQLMFQSLQEAIVLVDKKKIAFQNFEFESMMDHLRQLSSEVDNQKG